MKSSFAGIVFGLLFSGAVFSAPLDVPVRFSYYHADYVVESDGRLAETHAWSKTILKESALDSHKSTTVSYSHSAQQAEILSAYTLKASGQRVDVPKDNYQVQVNKGREKDAPVYSDWASTTVVFPDVAVGDSVVIQYRLRQTEPMFPGQFSTSQQFYRNAANDDVRVTFDLPASMPVRYRANQMAEKLSEAAGRRRIEWTFSNPQAIKLTRRDYSVFDPEKEVGYAISSFANHAEIASAYGARALPKAAVSERISKLAAEIVGQRKDKRAQAQALYEWVAANITYGGNCIGIGAVVPRDVDFVLDNKMGDCKDHATLLQALLAAQGIRSTQALVNAGSGYRLQSIPVASQVNHVINYLPDFALFVDSTSDSTPFGLLPYSVQDKPVLLVEGHRDGLKTPVQPASQHRQVMRNTQKISADGSISGRLEVEQNGPSALATRDWARKLTKDAEEELLKEVFRSQGLVGQGQFSKDDPKQLSDHFRYQASYSAEKYLKVQGSGGFYIHPVPQMASTIAALLQGDTQPENQADITCSGGSLIEEYDIELPKGRKILAVPENANINSRWLKYVATYQQQGNRIKVRRMLEDRTPGNVCSPEMMAEFKVTAEKVLDNLKGQVLYR